MAFIYYCNNPERKCRVGDCVIRSISLALNKTWDEVFWDLANLGFEMGDLPNANEVSGMYLYQNMFRKYGIAYENYTIKDFCRDYSRGIYIVCTGSHYVAVIDGDYYDTWDCGEESPLCYYKELKKYE